MHRARPIQREEHRSNADAGTSTHMLSSSSYLQRMSHCTAIASASQRETTLLLLGFETCMLLPDIFPCFFFFF